MLGGGGGGRWKGRHVLCVQLPQTTLECFLSSYELNFAHVRHLAANPLTSEKQLFQSKYPETKSQSSGACVKKEVNLASGPAPSSPYCLCERKLQYYVSQSLRQELNYILHTNPIDAEQHTAHSQLRFPAPSGTFLQTLLELVTPRGGGGGGEVPRSCPPTLSAPSGRSG